MSMTSPYQPNAKSAQPAVPGPGLLSKMSILCNSSVMHHTGGAPLEHQFRLNRNEYNDF